MENQGEKSSNLGEKPAEPTYSYALVPPSLSHLGNATVMVAPTGPHASTGATALLAEAAPTEAHAPISAHTTAVQAPTVASTPRQAFSQPVSVNEENNALTTEISPPRNRSGIKRIVKQSKRARVAHDVIAIEEEDEDGQQVTMLPTTTFAGNSLLTPSVNSIHNSNMTISGSLNAGFASLGLQNNVIYTRSQQNMPNYFGSNYASASEEATKNTFFTGRPPVSVYFADGMHTAASIPSTSIFPRAAPHSSTTFSSVTPIAASVPSTSIFSRAAPYSSNIFSGSTPGATSVPNISTFSRAAAPTIAPITSMQQGQHSFMFNSTGFAPGLHRNNTFNFAAPMPSHNTNTAHNLNFTNFPYEQHTMTDITLSSSHIAARHAMSKDLPSFSGNPEDWPIFITNYVQSTERCGFTDQENLVRLQKCLKGAALEAVRGKLMMPGTVSYAIETLRMLYGRPDVIHQSLQRRLRQQPNVKMEKMDTLISLSLAVQNYRATMQAIDLGDYLNDPMLLNELLLKLPSDLRLDWGRYRITRPRVDILVFDEWLFNLATCASQVTPLCNEATQANIREERKGARKKQHERIMVHDVTVSGREKTSCPKCSREHCLRECEEFRALRKDLRWKFIRDEKLCIRCFKKHLIRRCSSKQQCGVDGCQRAHNPLLHTPHCEPSVTFAAKKDNTEAVQNPILFHSKENKRAVFRYIGVTLHANGRCINTWAFIDEGSACTLMEQELANELGIVGPTEELCLQWTGDIKQNETNSQSVALHISSQIPDAKKFYLRNVRTLTTLKLPVQTLDISDISAREHLRDLPIAPYASKRARILIGLDNLKLVIPLETRESEGDELVAVRCKIGWSVYGRGEMNKESPQRIMHICACSCDKRIEELVKSHFSLESVGVRESAPLFSKEDERSQHIMAATTKYLPLEKRWETGLLWRHDRVELPDALPMARRRLQCLETKMSRKPDLKFFMINTIYDYEQKGYIRKLKEDEISIGGKAWYIPMFTVTNPNKNKTRLVWDAAAAVNNVALNSALMKGPDLLRSLVGVLIRFREQPIALSGDIREMFHQVRIRKEDQPAQQFLWRNGDSSKVPDVYVMQVLTFGATCSPSLANYVKNKNALRFQQKHSVPVKAILENTFVDDWLQSAPHEEDMIVLATTVRKIHAEGGFEMRNWISNSKNVLFALTGKRDQADKYIEQPDEYFEKVLGMWWSPGPDVLRFFVKFPKVIFNESVLPTKRQILRVVMTIFDPLGLLGFFIIYAKILMQEIWRSGVAWDEPIRQEELQKWWRWIRCMQFIQEICIPRCYNSVSSADRIELHIFVDASKDAYAAAVYLRAIRNNEIACSLVASKTRVAPLKPISIPRLELMAAILGLRLAKMVASELSVHLDQRIFWSDSKNVLYWIRSDARRFQQFVAVRIGEILEDSEVQEWRWVSSTDNVADEATKWSTQPDFDNASRWFTGPSFMYLAEDQWPKIDLDVAGDKEHDLICHVEVKQHTPSSLAIISPDPMHFSKWEKLRGAQSYVLKFLRRVWPKSKQLSKVVSLIEKSDIKSIEHVVIQSCQEEVFGEEIKQLNCGEPISRKSAIYKYSPYLDNFKLLRVKGRIDAMGTVDYDTRRPIILPRRHQVTYLIADFYHRKYHHHHNEIVVNEMRQRYSIPGLRAVAREAAKKCQLCSNRRAWPQPPEMAALPPERFATYSRPFTNTGIDYFGPFEITVGRRREKRWGVLFTCLTVRAVHLEIATSLSTDSFMLVLKQFIARRGAPRSIWSDNGTNFRGASRILQNEIERFSTEELEHNYPEIKWHFIPPATPHMGGCWERMVRSVKSILMDIIPNTGLREEVLRAAMADVENILNSRPLTYIPLDSPEMEALTPNHLLLGSSSGIREHDTETVDGGTLTKNFRIACQLADQFWKRWIREYAPCLTRRSKWFQIPPDPIDINDVVIIVDDKAKRNTWKKGIVIDVNRAKDGVARSAVVRTVDGFLTRPSVKLAKLDVRK